MNTYTANRDLTLAFDFKIGGEYVMADAGSLRLTIRDAMGVPFPAYDNKVLPDATINTIYVLIPASENALDPSKDFEPRFAELTFLSGGAPGSVKTTYRLIPFLPLQVTEGSVREALGVSYGELPDYSVDLFQSYMRLKDSPGFVTALTSGTVVAVYANQVLLYTEALRLAPSLRARILKQEEKDNALYTRFLMDFDQLKDDLQAALREAEALLDAELGQSASVAVTGFIVSLPTDPVTNT